jgi:ABC-type uncharacterized transport system permease subunit
LLGQNPRAARYAALSVNGMPYVLYGLVGVASAIAALVMVSYFGSARSDLGRDLLMPALTAAVLGGANIYGGSGSIVGTALAALLVGYLQQGLQMVGIPNQVSSALSGALLVVVVMGRSLSLHREWVRIWRRLSRVKQSEHKMKTKLIVLAMALASHRRRRRTASPLFLSWSASASLPAAATARKRRAKRSAWTSPTTARPSRASPARCS